MSFRKSKLREESQCTYACAGNKDNFWMTTSEVCHDMTGFRWGWQRSRNKKTTLICSTQIVTSTNGVSNPLLARLTKTVILKEFSRSGCYPLALHQPLCIGFHSVSTLLQLQLCSCRVLKGAGSQSVVRCVSTISGWWHQQGIYMGLQWSQVKLLSCVYLS